MILSRHYINSFLALVYNPFYKRTKNYKSYIASGKYLRTGIECVRLIPEKAGRTTSVRKKGDTPNLL